MKYALRFVLLLICISLFHSTAFSQKYALKDFEKVDSLASAAQPKAALALIKKINLQARADGNSVLLIKSVIYHMLFQSYLTEDALPQILTTLKQDINLAKQPEKSVLLSLLAETYWKYYQQNLYQISKRSNVQGDMGNDIRTWSSQQLVEQITQTFFASLKETTLLQNTPTGLLNDILIGDQQTRSLRPTLYDLLAHRAIDVFSNHQMAIIPGHEGMAELTSYSTFLSTKLIESDSSSNYLQTLQLFKNLLAFHQTHQNLGAFADVDLKRLNFIFKNNTHEDRFKQMDVALSLLAEQVKNTEIYADVLFQQASLLTSGLLSEGSDKLSLINAVELANQAINSYPKSIGGQNAENLLHQIKQPELNMQLKGNIPANRPAQIHFNYKNIDTVYLSIYQKPTALGNYNYFDKKEDYLKAIQAYKLMREWMVILPKSTDYRSHTYIDKMDNLPFGSYFIVAKGKKDNQDEKNVKYSYFQVSNLAITHRLSKTGVYEYFVKDSRNGKPLKDVVIQQKKLKQTASAPNNFNGIRLRTDQFGYAETNEINNIGSALFIQDKDSVSINLDHYYDPTSDDRKRVILFTDRSIYRPGQTLYYKGLYILNEMGNNKVISGQTILVNLYDANNKKLEEISVTTNEFGTFQGSFTIPIGKLNGSMRLHTSYGDAYIQVEEYKRPSFEIKFEKLTQTYKLNDSIKIQGTAQTFAGYSVPAAKVNYKIFQNTIYTDRYAYQEPKQVAFGHTLSKENGQFEFSFFAKATAQQSNYSFRIEVELTDINGETRSHSQTITVGKKDISLNLPLPAHLFLNNKPDTLAFFVQNLNNEAIKALVKTEWSLLKAPERLTTKSPFQAEKYSLDKADFIKNFPSDEYNNENDPLNWEINRIQFTQAIQVNDGKGKLVLQEKDFVPGFYKVNFSAINALNDTISTTRIVRIYGKEPSTIQNSSEWLVAEKNVISPTESAIFRIAGLAPNTQAYYEVYYRGEVFEKVWLNLSTKQSVVNIKPNKNFKDEFAVQFTMVYNGVVYNSIQKINIVDTNKQLEIKFLTFRNKLQPGEKESWKLQIKSRDGEKQLVEFLATLYDASLDELKKMDWNVNLKSNYNYHSFNWSTHSFNVVNGSSLWFLARNNQYRPRLTRTYESLNLFGFNYRNDNSHYQYYLRTIANAKSMGRGEEVNKRLMQLQKSNLLYGMVTNTMGEVLAAVTLKIGKRIVTTDKLGIYSIDAKAGDELQVTFIGYQSKTVKVGKSKRLDIKLFSESSSLQEVVVTAYGSDRKLTRSIGTLQNKRVEDAPTYAVLEAAVVSDNTVYTFNSMEAYDPKSNTRIVNGKPVSLKAPVEIRSNFNETAFFYPQLLTNEKGEINIEFTIPQSLTRYKMMGFAHTKDLRSAYISNELITQKQLAISANVPRFFREGDTILFSAKLNNLSGAILKGEASLELRDALSGKIIQILGSNTQAEQAFELTNNANSALKWALIIPSGLAAISYKLVAHSGAYSDGEEMTIPVLPNTMLVTESMPLNVRAHTSQTFNLEKLAKSSTSKTLKHQSLTFEFTSNPVWYAVQALPYLMEYPYECPEQTFSRFYANSFATGIINSSPKIKEVFNQWKLTNNGIALLSNLEKNPELKSILLEETPWVRAAGNETERKKRLAVLFDLNRMSYELKGSLDKLQQMQNENGSFSWFQGMGEDRYITQHLVLGMGQLKKSKLVDEKAYPQFNEILNKAVAYLDAQLIKGYHKEIQRKGVAYLPLHYLYARSYLTLKSSQADFDQAFTYYIKKIIADWRQMDSYQQGQAALILSRTGYRAEALKITNLLKQIAQQHHEMGMYWADNQAGWKWYQSPIETQSLLIEAFDEVTADVTAVEEMKIWLLKNKQTNDWKTTKATMAACYALLNRGYHLLDEAKAPEILIGGATLSSLGFADTPKEAGTGYQKININGAQVKPEMSKVAIKNNNNTIAWGSLYWQYFEQLDKITTAQTGLKIKKQLFLQKSTTKGDILTPINTNNSLSPGDLVKVRIEIYTDRDMEYVHLKDMRSSGLEPVNVISQYKYQDGLGYYESTKDASSNFFINYLQKGVYVFEYALRVTHSGHFSNGISTIQSMYAPAFAAHTEGIRLTVKP